MRPYYFSIIYFLLFFNSNQFQVKALSAVATLTLNISQIVISEAEKNITYTDVKDLADDLKRLTEVYCKYINERKNTIYGKYKIAEVYDIPLLKNYDFFIFGDRCEKVEYVMPDFTIPSFASNILMLYSIHENDYNLKGDEVWRDSLNEIHKLLTKIDADSGQSTLDSMTNEAEVVKCIKGFSQQQRLVDLLHYVATIDGMAYMTMQFNYASYALLFKANNISMNERVLESFITESILWKEKNIINKMKLLEKEFLERNTITANVLRAHMNVTRNLWNCKVEHEEEESNYAKSIETKMDMQIFQKYVINEGDLNNDGSCAHSCPDYKETKVYGCYDYKGICGKQRQCKGNLSDCQKLSSSTANVCLMKKELFPERYEYIEADNKRYGRYHICSNELVKVKNWRRGFYSCDYCMCTCQNNESGSTLYFNLRSVISDTNLNYVVTGIRFQKQNNILHIQIQQGKLVETGFIENSTIFKNGVRMDPIWKSIDNYTVNDELVVAGKDYHVISHNDRTICLDELDSPNKSHVVTGLRFKPESDNNRYLKLEIRLTPFDFKTGRLTDKDSYWYSNNAKLRDREELNLETFKATNLKSNQYVRFTTSPLDVDAGQTTIPYIDTKEVNSYLAVPFSGVGLFLAKNYILALKALTFDFEFIVGEGDVESKSYLHFFVDFIIFIYFLIHLFLLRSFLDGDCQMSMLLFMYKTCMGSLRSVVIVYSVSLASKI